MFTTIVAAIAQTPTATHATSSCVRVNVRGRRPLKGSHSSAAPRSMESYAVIVATRRGMTLADAVVTEKSGFRLQLRPPGADEMLREKLRSELSDIVSRLEAGESG